MNEQTFLQQIVNNPNDPTIYLILADWLEEYDDPKRAELLRLRCQLLTTWCESEGKYLTKCNPVPISKPLMENKKSRWGDRLKSFISGMVFSEKQEGQLKASTKGIVSQTTTEEKQKSLILQRAKWQSRMVELLLQGTNPPVPQMKIGLPNGENIQFNFISPGSFLMGTLKDEEGRPFLHSALHQVTISRGYWLGTTPITREQWRSLMRTDPSYLRKKGKENLPVETVSWNDCQTFIEQLPYHKAGKWSLPTEAEWEYACRCGTTTPFWLGETINSDQVNFRDESGNYRKTTTPVTQFPTNAWGLHDMHGNVEEWCQDWYLEELGSESSIDPIGPGSSVYGKVLRGGSWSNSATNCTSGIRKICVPNTGGSESGFRLAIHQK